MVCSEQWCLLCGVFRTVVFALWCVQDSGVCFEVCSGQRCLIYGVFEMCCLFEIPSSCFETLVNIKLDMYVRCETFSSQCVSDSGVCCVVNSKCVVCSKSHLLALRRL